MVQGQTRHIQHRESQSPFKKTGRVDGGWKWSSTAMHFILILTGHKGKWERGELPLTCCKELGPNARYAARHSPLDFDNSFRSPHESQTKSSVFACWSTSFMPFPRTFAVGSPSHQIAHRINSVGCSNTSAMIPPSDTSYHGTPLWQA